MNYREQEEQAYAAMEAAAGHLNGWTFYRDPDKWGARLHGPDGAAVYVSPRDGRISLGCEWPQVPNTSRRIGRDWHGYGFEEPSITVSSARPPEKIALDVERRLLEDYLRLYREALTKREEELAQRAAGIENRDAIAAILGEPPHDVNRYSPMNVNASKSGDPWYGDIKCREWGTDVDIELRSVPADMAARIALLIVEERKRRS